MEKMVNGFDMGYSNTWSFQKHHMNVVSSLYTVYWMTLYCELAMFGISTVIKTLNLSLVIWLCYKWMKWNMAFISGEFVALYV